MMTFQPSIQAYRCHYPALATKTYLNYGGQGPMAQAAIAALHDTQLQIQERGPFSSATNAWLQQESQLTRQAIAAELGTGPEAIALTENVTLGCNIALWSMDWREGDHLLLTDCEHPGVVGTANELQRRFGIKVSTCPVLETLNDGNPVEAIARHLLPTTRMVVVSHILWNTGQVLPLADIVAVCRQHPSYQPVRLLVDAAQSVGVLPLQLDALDVDFYAFTGHKWWCGAAGAGGLYVNPDRLGDSYPAFVGWRGVTMDGAGQPTGLKSSGERYEIATSAYPLYNALRTALALHQQQGSAADRYQRIVQLSAYLWHQLQALPAVQPLRTAPPESGLVSFQVVGASSAGTKALVAALEADQIMVRTLLHPDCIRACVHYFSTEDDCDRLIAALRSQLG
jgi:L-cysteine/cystine lyase